MDFIIKLPITSNGHDSIWVVVDRLPKFVHFLPIREDYKMERLAQMYVNEVLKLYGIPLSIISDRDSHFTSRFWQIFQKALGTLINLSTTYHPKTNGQTKRTIQTLEHMLRASANNFGGNWDTQLPLIDISTIPITTQESNVLHTKLYMDISDVLHYVGEKVFLKLSSWNGLVHFGKKRKLSPRYARPLEIIERIDLVSNKLKLP